MAMGYGKLLEIGKPEAGEVKTKKWTSVCLWRIKLRQIRKS